ncbi:MAG: hypothetical protein AAB263_05480, partial [Planctomycetota bacterium]
MDDLDRWCQRLARRRHGERTLRRVLPTLAGACLIGATLVAIVRLAVPEAQWLAPACVVLAVLAPVLVLPRVWRQRDPPWLIAGHIDHLARAHGLAMAMHQVPAAERDAAWMQALREHLARVSLPSLRLHGLVPALAAFGLLIGAWFLPQVSSAPPPPPVLGGVLSSVEKRLAELQDQQLAPPEVIDEMQQRLDDVRTATEAQGLNQQTWAALDALDHDLAAARANAADKLADALAKADALSNLSPTASADAAAHAAADLTAALAELEAMAPGLAAKIPKGAEGDALLRMAQQAAAGGELTDAQRQALQRFGLDPAKAGAALSPAEAAAQAAAAQTLAGKLA